MDSEEYKMSKTEWQMFKYQKKLDNFIEKYRYYCECGHSVVILPKQEKVFCEQCGHYVYSNKKAQKKNVERIKREDFRVKLNKTIKKEDFKSKLKERMKYVN